MSTTEKPPRLPSPPGSGAGEASDTMPSPNASTGPLFATSGFTAPLAASPFTTSYAPLQTVSTVSGASSHASVKQQSRAEVVARTVHLRCLPPFMLQKELADVFDQCGEYLRVRICGNAATHQKWVYGFVEFASPEAAAAMLTHSGMELSNGADKPPLRLKCSPSKQPILDCMAYDADVIGGTPCGFGRGYLAECTLNDALLVVGNGTGGAAGSVAGSASTTGGAATAGGAPAAGGRRTTAATRALTALTVCSIRKVAATGCGCGCSGVNCCGCCKCLKGEKTEAGTGAAAEAGDSLTKDSTHDEARGGGCSGCCGGGGAGGAAGNTETTHTVSTAGVTQDEGGHIAEPPAATTGCGCNDNASEVAAPPTTITSATFAELTDRASAVNSAEVDMLQQLAAAFQGLRSTAAAQDGQLDGPAIVRRAETMALDALTRASHLSSDTRIQDILCDLAQLLGFLDANAAVTGGAAQTASGDCTATLPQRVTQLRMLANLVGALLCLLRRSVADAVPYVEAVLVTFAQIPPSALLLRARQYEKGLAARKASGATAAAAPGGGKGDTEKVRVDLFGAPGERHAEVGHEDEEHKFGGHHGGFPLGAFIDEDVTDGLLTMVGDDDDDGDEGSVNGVVGGRDAKLRNAELSPRDGSGHVSDNVADHEQSHGDSGEHFLLNGDDSASTCSDESTAYMNSADMADLCRRDESFTRYVLNAVVAIGLAMESVQPMIARTAYTLANGRAKELLGEGSAMVTECLAASSSSSSTAPRLCEMLFKEEGARGKARDITFFPHRFFESVLATRQQMRDVRGTECFWRNLPPNHVSPLFKF